MNLFADDSQERELEFWQGFSRFQVPSHVRKYKGSAPAQVYLVLFRVACSVSYRSTRVLELTIGKPHSFFARQTKLSIRAVERAFEKLEADGLLAIVPEEQRVITRRANGTFLRNTVKLLHPDTRQTLYTVPGSFSVCFKNGVKPYVTVPRAAEERLHGMAPAGRHVGISALDEGSSRQAYSFGIRKDHFKAKTELERHAFTRGLTECEAQKLLTYAQNILTLLDPLTGKEPNRKKLEFIHHEDPNWQFDLNGVTADQWRAVVKRLLPYREFVEGSDGWTYTTGHPCPFCKTERAFSVNFALGLYKCYAGKTDRCAGFMGQLVKRLLRVRMDEAKGYIQEIIEGMEKAA